MVTSLAPTSVCLGFLTVVHDATGYHGGYLVTNQWGRPIEFRLTTSIQPNRVQQLLYGVTLQAYVRAELIAKTLVEKTAAVARAILTDDRNVLELRRFSATPVGWLAKEEVSSTGIEACRWEHGLVYAHPYYPADVQAIQTACKEIDTGCDWAEPFTRIRDAMAEARKMGVTGRGS